MDFTDLQEAKRRDFRKLEGEGQDAVTERMRTHKRNGKMFFQKGINCLMATIKNKTKLTHFLRYDDAANYFFKSGYCYRACGKWREAADSLTRCAQMYVQLKLSLEAAAVFVQASEVYMMLDKTEGYRSYMKAITLYCNIGRFDIAGRLEIKLAQQDFAFRHFEDALGHYRRASNFLAGESCLDQSDFCLERCAECYLEMQQWSHARKEFELVAEGCVNSNLRRFSAKEALKMASLCILAETLEIVLPVDEKKKKDKKNQPPSPQSKPSDQEVPEKAMTLEEMVILQSNEKKYIKGLEMIENYKTIDYTWSTTKELQFIRNIVKYRMAMDLDNFVDHLYYYNNVCPLSRYQLMMLQVPMNEISVEMARRATAIRQAELAAARQQRREAKIAAQKKLMADMGVVGEVRSYICFYVCMILYVNARIHCKYTCFIEGSYRGRRRRNCCSGGLKCHRCC
jgi:hypothetical protein